MWVRGRLAGSERRTLIQFREAGFECLPRSNKVGDKRRVLLIIAALSRPST